MTAVNSYNGAIRLKTDLPSPNTYFKVQPGAALTKTIGLNSYRPVSFSAFSILTNKKLLINGLPLFVATPSEDSEKVQRLEVTDTQGL